MMSDEDAKEYIEGIHKYEWIEPSRKEEMSFFLNTDNYLAAIFDRYGQYAAILAEEWLSENQDRSSAGIGVCLSVANNGLAHAASLYRYNDRNTSFRFYAKPIILEELEKLKDLG